MLQKTITQRNGDKYTFFFSEEDRDIVDYHQWYIHNKGKSRRTPYFSVCTGIGGYTAVPLARLIVNPLPGFEADHINGNSLDNRRENLRALPGWLNRLHLVKLQPNNISGFRGVSKDGSRYRARIGIQGTKVHLGVFATPEEASKEVEDFLDKVFRDAGYERNPK